MTTSNKKYFMFNKNFPSNKDVWFDWMSDHSKLFKKFGSFRKPQVELLDNLYHYFSKSSRPISIYTEPPASGKTHIISLTASFLADQKLEVCICVPNSELKTSFEEQDSKINNFNSSISILTLSQYMQDRSKFDFVLVDEAHNLQSAFNFNKNITKHFIFRKGDFAFEFFIERYLKNLQYNTTILSLNDSHDILNLLKKSISLKQDVSLIRKSLTSWVGFISVTPNECKITFQSMDPSKRSILPKGKLLLFSATSLNLDDLNFYCNVSKTQIQSYATKIKPPKSANSSIHFSLSKKIDDDTKYDLVTTVLSQLNNKSLILFNNSKKCEEWTVKLRQSLSKNRIYSITSGLSSKDRLVIYEKYLQDADGILLSSSTVYWEGITIKNLKLVLIPDLPFPEPNLLDLYHGIVNKNKIIHQRIIQGLGRIGRIDGEDSVGILCFPYKKLSKIKSVSESNLFSSLETLI